MTSMNLIKDMVLIIKQQDTLTREELQAALKRIDPWADIGDFDLSLRLALRRGILVETDSGLELGRPLTPGVDYPRHPALVILGALGLVLGIVLVVIALGMDTTAGDVFNTGLLHRQGVLVQLGIGSFVSGLLCVLRFIS